MPLELERGNARVVRFLSQRVHENIVRANLGERYLYKALSSEWKCFACDPTPLAKLPSLPKFTMPLPHSNEENEKTLITSATLNSSSSSNIDHSVNANASTNPALVPVRKWPGLGVGARVETYWDIDRVWYGGSVIEKKFMNDGAVRVKVKYDDNEEHWENPNAVDGKYFRIKTPAPGTRRWR
uniref:Uncharacterized protein n=1 Tax=Lotharella globosa TaxID=91324 RepID=A0A7S3Z9P6_9EUKA|mmetsp:Transcript_36347/g.70138  ORF Transcript_36347/g.70138 Transcript_36347/m.70138 type:complete len:183 (+) Transcript_36347:117-665(+)